MAPPLTPAQVPLLFVGGLHRSGTTALARVLASAPGIRGLTGTGVPEDEGQHLQRALPTAAQHGGPGTFAFDPGSHLTEESALARPATARTVLSAWQPYWHLDDGERPSWGAAGLALLEKSPPNLLRTRLLQALFPSARFVLVLRHPAVVSLSTAAWRPHLAVGTLLRHWLLAHETAAADVPALRDCVVVRYEDLAAAPQERLDDLTRRLDVDTAVEAELFHDANPGWLEKWPGRVRTVGTDERRSIEARLAPFGYRLRPPYVVPPEWAPLHAR